MTDRKRRFLAGTLSLYIAFVFIQSLFFKFTDSPETQYIFGTLDAWAASLGFAGLFAPNGPFSQYVVGSAELVASLLLLAGLFTGRVPFQAAGALLALGVISGAIFFHLFTPLGVQVVNTDGSLTADSFSRLPAASGSLRPESWRFAGPMSWRCCPSGAPIPA